LRIFLPKNAQFPKFENWAILFEKWHPFLNF